MSDEGLVDILLVRLGRDEEKERVKNLLMKELGFSEEEAAKAVAKTPNMIRKAVPMGKGRVIQNRLYPYIDLLPRMDLVDDEPEEEEAPPAREAAPQPEEAAGPATETEPEPAPRSEGPSETHEVEEEVQGLETAAATVMEGDSDGVREEPGPSEEQAEEDAEDVVVTSAAEEMRQIERCHICGRTPVDGEKLAPCRSCGDLTCRDCFDRVAHVCTKCASNGKFVDKPPQRKRAAPEAGTETRRRAAPVQASGGPRRGLLAGVVAAFVVVLLLAVFYFIDPMDMFSADDDGSPAAGTGGEADTVAAVADTSMADTAAVDSNAATVDTTAADTVASVQEPPGPLNLQAAVLDSASAPVDPPEVRTIRYSSVSGLTVLTEELESIADDLGRMASAAGIEIDGVTLFRTSDEITVLALAVLHPEEDTRRYALLRSLGHYLAPTGVDELVFYYRENQYYDARVVPYLNADFESLSQATGPMDFQDLTGCTSAEQWELLNGPVSNWMTSI